MTGTAQCLRATDLGVYVLGALDIDARADVDEHLAVCPQCRAELAELAGLPSLLGSTTLEDLAVIDALPPVRLALPGTGTGQARRGRLARYGGGRLVLTAAAAAAVAAVTLGGGLLAARPGPAAGTSPPAAASGFGPARGPWLTAHSAAGKATVTVMYRAMGWGTQLQAMVNGLPAGTQCQLQVITETGSRLPAGAWATDSNEGRVSYPGSTSAPAQAIRGFAVTVAGGKSVSVPAAA